MSQILRWEDPPERAGMNNDYNALMDELKQNPGVFALVFEDVDDNRYKVAYAALRARNCEVRRTQTGKKTGRYNVYVKYKKQVTDEQ